MRKYLPLLGFGICIWLLPFLFSFLIFPIHETNRPLFESLMPVAVVACVVLFSVLYFKRIEQVKIWEGLLVGGVWFFISIIFDLLMFLPQSSWQMTLSEYFMDIGLTYLIILFIPLGFAVVLSKK